nr:MAG TPA: hypothetical protein [Caudoviricetes sp.]
MLISKATQRRRTITERQSVAFCFLDLLPKGGKAVRSGGGGGDGSNYITAR